MRIRRTWVVAACAAAALGLGACGDDDDAADGGGGTTSTTSTPSTGATTAADGVDQAAIDYGVKMTGGTAGKADAHLSPVKIGYINQEGVAPSFPEQTGAADAAVSFINDHLGGIGGHPLELVKCIVQSEEDGQKCAAQMVNAKLPLINEAVLIVGTDSLHKTVAGQIPTLNTSPTSVSDLTSPHVYTMIGGAAALVNAQVQQAQKLGAKRVAVFGVSNSSGKFVVEKLLVPTLDGLGITHNKPVYFPDDATAPDVLSVLQAADVRDADASVFIPSTPALCSAIYDGFKQLGVSKPAIGTLLCNADEFINHANGSPENWYLVSFGTNPRDETDPEAKVYNAVMDAYGQGKFRTVGQAIQSFSDMLLVARWGNAIGADKLTPEAFERQIRSFKGPVPLNPSDISCDPPADQAQPALCGNAAAASRFKDGTWENLGAFKRAPSS